MILRGVAAAVAVVFVGLARADKHHGIVFDAGSSGSRIHVYTWEAGGDHGSFELVSDDLLKIKPGLSSFKDETSKAGSSLDPLLKYAYDRVPEKQRPATPAYLMATAGLRLVGETKKDEILQSVCRTLESSQFEFKCAWANLLSGFDEGLYGWVTVNYLKDALKSAGDTTYGTIDLGGGSVQIVYEPKPGTSLPSAYAATVPLAQGSKSIYVKSHLGYGLDEARRTVNAIVAKETEVHPCLPKGYVGIAGVSGGGTANFKGTGSYEKCVSLTEKLFPKAECPKEPCSIQGAFQPDPIGQFIGFSYMYDRTKQIGLLDGKSEVYGEQTMTIDQIKAGAAALCTLSPEELQRKYDKHPEQDKVHNFCGDVVFIALLLERGFGFQPSTSFLMTNKINNIEIVWTLGAMLAKVNAAAARGSSSTSFFIVLALIAAIGFCFRRRLFGSSSGLPFRTPGYR